MVLLQAFFRLLRSHPIRLCAAIVFLLLGLPARAAQRVPLPPEALRQTSFDYAPFDFAQGRQDRQGELRRAPLPAEAREGMRLVYSGEPDRAIELFRKIQQAQPEHPLGYLLEANAMWWKFFCEACDIKYNLIDAWKRGKIKEDEQYFALADKGIQLAEAQLKTRETPEMRFYAGMGYALKARLHGLRDERRALANSGVKARGHLLRAIELDPNYADAYTGVGLYNYYADALSSFAKVLRFFMGIPGGSKKEGTRQLEIGMRGEITGVEARFYLAKCLRNYDQKYEPAIELMQPLVAEFPQNPIFHLMLGDLYAKLRRNEQAAAQYDAASRSVGTNGNSKCAARIRQVAQTALDALERR